MVTRDARRTDSSAPRGLWHPLPRGNALGRMLLAVTTALVIFGTIFVASASEGQSAADGGTAFSIMIHDVAYLCLGIFALYLASRVRLERLVKSAPLIIGSGLVLLLAVKAVGVTTNGGKRWLNLRVIDLQPSELFKLCVVLFIAWLVLHHHDELNNWKQLLIWTTPVWIGCGFIVLEPDIGTATVVLVIARRHARRCWTIAAAHRRRARALGCVRRGVSLVRAVLGQAILFIPSSQPKEQPARERLSAAAIEDWTGRRRCDRARTWP